MHKIPGELTYKDDTTKLSIKNLSYTLQEENDKSASTETPNYDWPDKVAKDIYKDVYVPNSYAHKLSFIHVKVSIFMPVNKISSICPTVNPNY